MITIFQHPDKFVVKSKYNTILVELIKKCQPRQWDPSEKIWFIGINNYEDFINSLEHNQLAYDCTYIPVKNSNVKATIEEDSENFSLAFYGLIENFEEYRQVGVYKDNKITYPLSFLQTIVEKLKKERISYYHTGEQKEIPQAVQAKYVKTNAMRNMF